jgi:hypothetical protein
MNARQVCTGPTNYGRIVSAIFHYLGATLHVGSLLCGSGKILASGKAENARYHLSRPRFAKRTTLLGIILVAALGTLTEQLLLGTWFVAGWGSQYPRGSASLSTTQHQAKRFPQTPAQVLDLILINLIYSLTKGSSFYSVHSAQTFRLPFAPFAFFRVNLFKSAFHNHLCAHERPVYRALLEIIGFELSFNLDRVRRFASPLARAARTEGQDESELYSKLFPIRKGYLVKNVEYRSQVLDLILISLIYSLTKGSSFDSIQWPSAKTPQTFRFPFEFFALFVVNLFKSAFRNRLCTHERPVYRALSEIIGFEISFSSNRAKPFSSPRGRGYSAGAARTEGELFPCSTEPLVPSKIIVAVCKDSRIKNVHGGLDFLKFFEIFGFRFQAKNPPLFRSNLVTEGSNFQIKNHYGQFLRSFLPGRVQNLQFHTILHSGKTALKHSIPKT